MMHTIKIIVAYYVVLSTTSGQYRMLLK